MTSAEKVRLVVGAIDSKLGRDVVLLDLQGLTLMTDYFVVCSGTSSVHIRTICDHVTETMKAAGLGGIRVEGYDAARWVLMDYQDVVVHVMAPEQRAFYDLESFWTNAKRLPIEDGIVPDLTRDGD